MVRPASAIRTMDKRVATSHYSIQRLEWPFKALLRITDFSLTEPHDFPEAGFWEAIGYRQFLDMARSSCLRTDSLFSFLISTMFAKVLVDFTVPLRLPDVH